MTDRTAEIVAEVTANGRNHWDAHDGGRWAHSMGIPREKNPHYHPLLPWHINISDWDRGWAAALRSASLVEA